MVAASKTALGAVVVIATMVVSLGVAVPSSSASSSSSFCKSIKTYKPTTAPTAINTKSYHAWAKALLPFYEKLTSEAPNAKTKQELNELVTILKYEANSSSLTGLESYISAHGVAWANGLKALVSAFLSCAY
jgi:hypothetical protein